MARYIWGWHIVEGYILSMSIAINTNIGHQQHASIWKVWEINAETANLAAAHTSISVNPFL
ncbi:MAG: hypothetical protein ACR5K7_05740 [Symbiopectobacterium sp.]